MNTELHLTLSATDQGLVGTVAAAHNETEAFNATLVDSEQAATAASHSQNELSLSNEETGSSFNAGAIKAGLWGAAVAGATLVAGALATSLRTDAIREMQIMSETLGVSTQALSEWGYAAASVNISGEKVADIFKDASDKIGDFVATGGGEAADLFENLNIQVKDLAHLAPDQQLLKIGEALDDVGSRGEKIFYLEALANDASRLLPLLENNASELKRMQLEAQVLGVSLNDIDASKVTAASRSMDRVGGLFKGVANDITIELAPILGGVSDLLVDSAVQAGGFRSAMQTAIDYTVIGVGYVLDVLHADHILLKVIEKGWLSIGQAGTSAMASVAESTAAVINTVMRPFQTSLAWIIDKYAFLIELGAEFGGPFADEFAVAAKALKGYSAEIDNFSVSAEDIIALNETVTESLKRSSEELQALINADAPSEKLQAWVDDLRKKSEEAAKAQSKLRTQSTKTTKALDKQKDVYGDLVKELENELSLLKLGERARAIEIAQRKLGASATQAQKDKITELSAALFDYKAELKANEDAAKVWSDITDNAIKSVDDSFRELFRSGLDGWDSFWDQMLDTAKDMLAELAYTLVKEKLWVNVGLNATGSTSGAQSGSGGLGGFSIKDGIDLFNPSSGGVVSGINSTAYKLGYGSNPALSNNVAAIKNGDFSSTLVNPNGFAAKGLNAIGPGLSAYGFAQKYGTAGGIIGGAGTAAAAGALTGGAAALSAGTGVVAGAGAGAYGALSTLGPAGWAAIAIGALLGGRKKPSDKTQSQAVDLDSFDQTYSGLSGKKFDQENLDNSSAISGALSVFTQLLEQKTGTDINGGLQVTTGGRDGQRFLYSPDGIDTRLSKDTNVTASDTVISGGSGAELLQNAALFLADIAGIDPAIYTALAKENENLVSAYARLESQVDLVNYSFTDLGIPTADLAGNALTAADAIISANGGLEQYTALQGFVNANFISEEERRLAVVSQAQTQLDEWNSTLQASGETAITSKDNFLTYIRGLDQTTDAGRALYAAALELAPALVTVANETEAAVQQISTIDVDALLNTARKTLSGALEHEIGSEQGALDGLKTNLSTAKNAYLNAINAEIGAQSRLINSQASAASHAQQMVSTWRDVALTLKQTSREIISGTFGTEQVIEQQKQRFDQALKSAWAGNLDAFKDLPGLATAYQETASSGARSTSEARRIAAEIAAQLNSAGDLASNNQSAEQRTIASINRQTAAVYSSVDALEQLKVELTAVEVDALGLSEAEAAFNKATAELNNEQHSETLAALQDELAALQSVNDTLISLEDAREQYQSAALAVAGESGEILGQQLTELSNIASSLQQSLEDNRAANGETITYLRNMATTAQRAADLAQINAQTQEAS